MSAPLQWSFGPFRLDAVAGCLWQGDELVELSPKPMALLTYLVAHAGQVVSKESLLDAVWPETSVTEGVLKTNMGLIRQVLGETARTPQYISTVRGRGYRFIGPVTSVAPSTPTIAALSEVWQPQIHTEALEVPSPIIGREAELARLHAHFEKACQGERQLVSITGEPGIGKTTLVDAFVSQVASSRPLWQARGQCIDHYGAGEAYLPLLDALGRLARGENGNSLVEVLRRQAPSWLMHFPALGHPEDLEKWQGLQGMVTRQRMLRELVDAVETLTLEQPLILVLEDLHWSDASTVDWLGYVARRRDVARLLILGTYRPVDTLIQAHPIRRVMQELQRHGQCTELALPYFTEREIAAYLEQQFTSTSLPKTLPVTLRQRTGGNPFFLVTMVGTLAQADAFRTNVAQGDSAERLDVINIETPESIRALIHSQLERLEPEDQNLLEAASVAGREFTAPAVAACVVGDIESVESRFEALVQRRQFIEAHDTEVWPDGTLAVSYTFIHTLNQEVVYNRLPMSRKMRWHRQIGIRKEIGYGERAGEYAAELADHFLRGQEWSRALQYLRQAGENAMCRAAHEEAMGHLTKGLEILDGLPPAAQHPQVELAFQLAMGAALIAAKGYAVPEVNTAYTRARELSRDMGPSPRRLQVLLGLHAYHLVRGSIEMAREVAEEGLALAQAQSEPERLQQSHYALGVALLFQGDIVRAREHLEQGIHLYRPIYHRPRAVQDTGVTCLSCASSALWTQGQIDQARQRGREAVTLARQLSHPFSLAQALYWRALVSFYCGEWLAAQEQITESLVLSHEYGFPYWLAIGDMLQGRVQLELGQAAEGLRQISQGLSAYQAIGARAGLPTFLAWRGEAEVKMGQPTEGLVMLAKAIATVAETSQHWCEAEMYRLQGELLLQEGEPSQASANRSRGESYLARALDTARRQQAKSWELRAAMSLGRWWQQQGKSKEAHELLAPVYDWFTEGFDTTDLIKAKGFLEELELELT
jgi:predicted ATPase/DNA-binding winged helix-turn-helix (wHTH) protein